MAGVLAGRTILRMLKIGVAAVAANIDDELDDLLEMLDDDERQKVKDAIVANPPSVISGYARHDTPFPVFAVTLQADTDNQEFLDEADQDVFDEDDVKTGHTRERRRSDTIGVYVYAQNRDMCEYLYHMLKRIVESGTLYMVQRGLDLPRLSGQELVPDPNSMTDQMFTRRLSITVDYEDTWPAQGALWEALNGAAEAFVTVGDKVDAFHEDIQFDDDDGDQFGGTIVPVDDEEDNE